MIDAEREIREALQRHERDLPVPSPVDASTAARRARRRQVRNGVVAAVVATAVAVTLTGGVSAVLRADRRLPADTPTPTPSLSLPGLGSPTEAGLYVLDAESGESTLLLHGRWTSGEPTRSPDGTRFAYVARVPGVGRQIFVREPDGTERRITDLEDGAGDPDWSPDGTRIAFAGRGAQGIWVVNADGSGLRRLGGSGGADADPDWSPDGTRIAFSTGSGTHGAIWLIGVDDGTMVQLTGEDQGDGDRSPAWSPDGTLIAFLRFEDAPGHNLEADDEDIWVMDADGSNEHRLVEAEGPNREGRTGSASATPDGHWQSGLAWSPDGGRVAFADVHYGVRVLDIATQEIEAIAFDFANELQWDAEGILASWAPYRE